MTGSAYTNDEKRGLIFDIQPFSIHDGPGIRTTVFLKGCPFSCEWCDNPESQNPYPEIMTRNIRCCLCGMCVKTCPVGAISLSKKNGRKIDWSKCNMCLECARACPQGAIITQGRYMAVEEIVDEVARDIPFFRNSGGGITMSGGEPLQQWEFVTAVFKQCREKSIHTALETTAHAPWERFEAVLNHLDLLLVDVKHMNPKKHKRYTGVSNKLILDNIQKAVYIVKTWIRVPLIPGFNDSDSDIQEIASFSSKLPVEKVSILPFHKYGEEKYEALGREYIMKDIQLPSKERVEDACNIVKSFGLNCTIKY